MTLADSIARPAQKLLGPWSATLETRDGVRLNIRPASPDDAQTLIDFFTAVSPNDLQFRFLSAVARVGETMVRPLVEVDHDSTENLLAFDARTGLLVATAMIAADPDLSRAEVAIAVRADYRHRGVGWTLLHHAADYAAARGICRLESIERCDNRAAISLEREMGFTARICPGDATLVVVGKDLAGPA